MALRADTPGIAGGAYVPTVFVGMYAPLGMRGWSVIALYVCATIDLMKPGGAYMKSDMCATRLIRQISFFL